MHLLKDHQTGITGLIGWVCVTIVTLPFGVKRFRKLIPYEIRKWFHVVGGIGFALSGALHAPATRVIYVYMSALSVYLVDWIVANFYLTYFVEVCHFTRLQESVVLHWEDPKGYKSAQHGYVNICIPFVNRFQWHAISVYPHAHHPNSSSLCIAKAGDWSNKLHDETSYKTTRPVWIQGPFLTPFSASVEYDNAICVSSGSGISASIAAIQSLKHHRRVSFIWLCRDASMVEFYLNTYDFDDDAYTLIYYTGRQKLSVPKSLPPFVLIFETRPDLRSVICMIIKSIESQDCLPEHVVRESEDMEETMRQSAVHLANVESHEEPLEILHKLLGRSLKHYTMEELVKMLIGPADELTQKDLEHLLYKVVPEATFSAEALAQLAIEFSVVSDDGSKKPSRKKLTEYCHASLEDYMGSHTAESDPSDSSIAPTSSGKRGRVKRSSQDAAAYLSKSGGDELLKKFIAALEEDKADRKLNRWAVLYCGGSAIIADALTQVCSDFDIKYNQEKFDW
jgi:hypothetical protein